ncbi:hypothetical protein [Acetivibrio ethanolgignens]|uniref:Uncharacterized protein n=1 Tax=Acetivibrio ethanolgignens TaxID=290052 RepID=A0A0V8QG28_9FIRM|nr:hypothetical protein [Acetivibrio ethanolgignens]KSV59508.1 hypothetical protein ASU35_08335 [Acetivibrio ethanolgignens]
MSFADGLNKENIKKKCFDEAINYYYEDFRNSCQYEAKNGNESVRVVIPNDYICNFDGKIKDDFTEALSKYMLIAGKREDTYWYRLLKEDAEYIREKIEMYLKNDGFKNYSVRVVKAGCFFKVEYVEKTTFLDGIDTLLGGSPLKKVYKQDRELYSVEIKASW